MFYVYWLDYSNTSLRQCELDYCMILDVNCIAAVKSMIFCLIIMIELYLESQFSMLMAINGLAKLYIIQENARDLAYQMGRDVSSFGAQLNHSFLF